MDTSPQEKGWDAIRVSTIFYTDAEMAATSASVQAEAPPPPETPPIAEKQEEE